MEKYDVTGMSCAACSARVEKAVKKVDGVSDCSVNLLTNSMSVEGSADPQKIINAVEKAGYGAKISGAEKKAEPEDNESIFKKENSKIIIRLVSSVLILAVLMYISMGYVMWGFPLPQLLSSNPLALGIIEMILSASIMVINQSFFIKGFKGLIHFSPNMDTLVAMGSGVSFLYSVYLLIEMTYKAMQGQTEMLHGYLHSFYFEAAAMILTLITVGKMLEARSKGKTADALKSLISLAPKTAIIIKDGQEIEVSVDEINTGDIFVVYSGSNIAVDGVVLEGTAAVDESVITGESIPVDKKAGDTVSCASVNKSGYIKCRATRVGEDTTLSQIIQMVKDSVATKAPIAKIADKVSGVFVPVVIVIALVTVAGWLIAGETAGFALARGISVLVISCPCALGLATPVAIMVGNGLGAKNGILFKNSTSLEQTGRADIVVLDKTGTITYGKPQVTDVITAENAEESDLLAVAYSLESKSEHPVAEAVKKYGKEKNARLVTIDDYSEESGNGIKGIESGKSVRAGNYNFVSSEAEISSNIKLQAERLADEGKTPLFFSRGNSLLGVIAVADVIKEEAPEAVKQMKNMGLRVVMLTGDNEKTAKAIGKKAGVDEIVAGVLPKGKEQKVKELKKEGKVIMVGDGINDAPALTAADIGMAIGAGTDIAVDAAQIVLVKSRLSDVPSAIRLSRATLKTIHQNLFWAFFYNAVGIPLAAGVFIKIFGWELNPMFGAAAMSLSSFFVVTNALRLNLFDMHSAKKDKKIRKKQKHKEEKTMTTEIKIEGMMCPHCEANVKATLEALPQVDSADVSHTRGSAVVTLNSHIDFEELKQAVENKGYKVVK